MKQTPVHFNVNYDLLKLIPLNAKHIVEVGCMQGQMAEAYLKNNPTANYIGIDIEPSYVKAANKFCTKAMALDIDKISKQDFEKMFPSDCWVFGDCLEHLRDPWSLLKNIRNYISHDGCLVACIPNAQHWSVQYRLLSGEFRYEDSGLMDRTHIRWFTRNTIRELFHSTGWRIDIELERHPQYTPLQDVFIKGLGDYAKECGLNADGLIKDSLPIQYVYKVSPA